MGTTERAFTDTDRARMAGFVAATQGHDCHHAEIRIDALIAGSKRLADERAAAVAALAVARADYALLRRQGGPTRDAPARRGATWRETLAAASAAWWAGLDSLHRQTWALAALLLLAGFVAATLLGGH